MKLGGAHALGAPPVSTPMNHYLGIRTVSHKCIELVVCSYILMQFSIGISTYFSSGAGNVRFSLIALESLPMQLQYSEVHHTITTVS